MRTHSLATVLIVAASLSLSACKDKIPPSPQDAADRASMDAGAEPATPAARQAASKPASPERIAEIEATGRTGLWADPDWVCSGTRAKDAPSTTLTWNVKDTGAQRVVVYVVGRKDVERNFGQGGPVGEKRTGPWLRSGLEFRLRDREDKRELAKLAITERDC